MSNKRYKPEQVVTLLRQIEAGTGNGKTTPQVCKEAGITVQTFYRWRKEYGGLKLDQARRMKELEKENTRLKRLVAEISLEKQVLKEVASGNFYALDEAVQFAQATDYPDMMNQFCTILETTLDYANKVRTREQLIYFLETLNMPTPEEEMYVIGLIQNVPAIFRMFVTQQLPELVQELPPGRTGRGKSLTLEQRVQACDFNLYGFIVRCKLGVLSTIADAGTPQSALVGIAVTPNLEIIFDTVKSSRKYQNLVARPRCSFVVGWAGEQHRAVQRRGYGTPRTGIEKFPRCVLPSMA